MMLKDCIHDRVYTVTELSPSINFFFLFAFIHGEHSGHFTVSSFGKKSYTIKNIGNSNFTFSIMILYSIAQEIPTALILRIGFGVIDGWMWA